MCNHSECCNYCERTNCNKTGYKIKIKEDESKIKIVVDSKSLNKEEVREKVRGLINDIFNESHD